MRTDPIRDFFTFLAGPFYSEPGWVHVFYWVLALASIAVAVFTWRFMPPTVRAARGNRSLTRPLDMRPITNVMAPSPRDEPYRLGANPLLHLVRFAIRFLLASFWWQQSLWKFPTDIGGLRYWTEQEVAHSAFKIQSHIVESVVLPFFTPFAYAVYAFEVLVAVTLFLGVGVRLFGTLGALLILSLFLGLYQAPQEWPWSYVFLLVLMIVMVVEDYGLSLGLDSWLAARRRTV